MNEAEAREILKHPFSENVISTPWDKDLHLDGKAKGYLECLEKAKVLEEYVKEGANKGYPHAQWVISKWEEER